MFNLGGNEKEGDSQGGVGVYSLSTVYYGVQACTNSGRQHCVCRIRLSRRSDHSSSPANVWLYHGFPGNQQAHHDHHGGRVADCKTKQSMHCPGFDADEFQFSQYKYCSSTGMCYHCWQSWRGYRNVLRTFTRLKRLTLVTPVSPISMFTPYFAPSCLLRPGTCTFERGPATTSHWHNTCHNT